MNKPNRTYQVTGEELASTTAGRVNLRGFV